MIETENKVYARRCESHVEALRRAVPGCIEKVEWQCEDQLTITVKQDKLPEAVHYLYYERYGWIPVIIGNDERSLCGRYAVYYVISMEGEDPGWVTVRTEVDPAKMTFPSVTPFVPACVWGERELRDMFGLIPEGLPDRRRLVLPDDWPSGLYPLRKDSMDYRFRPLPRATWKTTSSWPIPRARRRRLSPWARCTLPPTSPATSACSLRARRSSTPTTVCSTCTAAWRRSPRRA